MGNFNNNIELPYRKLNRIDSLDQADQEFERLEGDIADMNIKLTKYATPIVNSSRIQSSSLSIGGTAYSTEF